MQSEITMPVKRKDLKAANIKLIQQIKKELKEISVAQLCAILKYSRQNLSLHLSYKNIETPGKTDHLMKIYQAIASLKIKMAREVEKKLTTINETLNS